MFGFQNWRQVRAAYQQNADKVRAVFEGCYSPGLINRLCCDLNTEGRFDCCETRMQAESLSRALRGVSVRYDWKEDPELGGE